jgi:hypothetical protein
MIEGTINKDKLDNYFIKEDKKWETTILK